MIAPSIHLVNASLEYCHQPVFDQINAVFPAGKWTAILGKSGIGKSSLLRLMAGLTRPEEKSQGMIYADNHSPLAKHIAYMAQTDLLLPWLTVLQNANLGSKLRRLPRSEKTKQRNKVITLLEQVGLGSALDLYPSQLSGGMRQRVALVRTLIENKPIILMDEPFSALDAITRYQLQTLAVSLLKDKTVLFITHDPIDALRLAHTIYLMHGNPVDLQRVAELNSDTPRSLDHPDMLKEHAALMHILLQSAGETV